MTIWTSSWSTKMPPGHTRIRISRGGPRWLPAGSYKTYSALFPGKWFNSVSPQEYLDLYNAITRGAAGDRKRSLRERILAGYVRVMVGAAKIIIGAVGGLVVALAIWFVVTLLTLPRP